MVSKTLVTLSILIALLVLVAAGMGVVYQGDGAPYAVVSLRGETVAIQGHGLYRYDPVSVAAQEVAQDVVTLGLGLPLLLVSLALYRRGQLRGRLLLAGTLAYFLYTYASMAFGTGYNPLFLVYVALFALSLFGLIAALTSIDMAALPGQFGGRLPRRGIAAYLLVTAALVTLLWLGRIVPALLTGAPPAGLDTATTLFIQVLDLGVVIPVMVLTAVWLLRRRPLGYLLASVCLVKIVSLGAAVVAMAVGQWLVGAPLSPAEVVIFPAITLIGAALTALLLRALRECEVAPAPAVATLALGKG